jgi:prophage tail gpP-like protein
MGAVPNYGIRVGNYDLREINSLSLRLSMREIADSFTAQISDRVTLRAGLPVQVSIDGRPVIVGELQNVRLAKSAGTRDLSISGFSSAQRLVKSSVVPGDGLPRRTVKGLSLREIVEAVVEPFGIVVDVSEAALSIANEPIDKVRVGNGQTCHAFLNKVCKRQGCILVSGAASVGPDRNAKASVRITRVAVRKSPINIVYPSARVLSIDYEDDVRAIHSQYLVTPRGRPWTGLDGLAEDERVSYSPVIIQAEAGGRGQAAMDRQAEWEMRRRAAEGQRVSVTYDGWSPRPSTTPPSPLWWPNTLFRVVDAEDGFDETMLLASVELGESVGSGAVARLELMPPDAYAILEQRKITSGSRRGYAANTEWLAQHSELVGEIAAASDTVDYDEKRLDLIWKPEDPDA